MEDDRLLARMEASKAGWGPRHLATLYTSFGFKKREGARHTLYSHPDHPELRATVARSGPLAIGYITTAIRLIRRLKATGGDNAPSH